MNISLENELFYFNSNRHLKENMPLVLSKETPLSIVLINARTDSQMNKAFTLFVTYWGNSGKNITIPYSFFHEFTWKLLIPADSPEHNNFLCKSITFEYQESDIQTDSINDEMVFNFSATEINEVDRKRYTDDLTSSIEEYNNILNE